MTGVEASFSVIRPTIADALQRHPVQITPLRRIVQE